MDTKMMRTTRSPVWKSLDGSVSIFRQEVGNYRCYQVRTSLAVVTVPNMDAAITWLTNWRLPAPPAAKSW